jgi:hypothetical protein
MQSCDGDASMQARAQVADALLPPPAEERAERHHSVASDVLAELRVQVKRPVGDGLHACPNAPDGLEAGYVYIEEGDYLPTTNQSREDTREAQCQLQCTTGIHTMRMLGVVSERNSASLPVSHARIIQPTTESFEAVASAPPTE